MEDTKANRLLVIIANMSIGELPESHGKNGNTIWNAFHIGVQWQKLQDAQQNLHGDLAGKRRKRVVCKQCNRINYVELYAPPST